LSQTILSLTKPIEKYGKSKRRRWSSVKGKEGKELMEEEKKSGGV
jgi:hypothetical protein